MHICKNSGCNLFYFSQTSKATVSLGRDTITGKELKKTFVANTEEEALNLALEAKLNIDLVLVGKDAAKGDVESLGENRARYTTGVCSGMVLLPDVWSLSDSSGRGDARLSIERARQVAMNAEVNTVGRIGRSFRPLYGGRQWRAQTGAAENLVTLRTDSALYLAAINYADQPLNVTVPLADLYPSSLSQAKELWTGETVILSPNVSLTQPQLLISVPAKDARLYRFTLK